MPPTTDSQADAANERFAATRWSLVAAAGAQDESTARRALIELCLRYWYPVYAYVRGCGHGSEAAQDITRGFFDDLLSQHLSMTDIRARGRFREFLLATLNRFLHSDWRELCDRAPVAEFEHAVAWGALESRHLGELAGGLTPEQNYQRSYALEVLGCALARLRREAEQAGKLAMFVAMQPFLNAEPVAGEFTELARELGIGALAAVVALKRLRQRFRELAESELAETVVSANDLVAEREALARALALR